VLLTCQVPARLYQAASRPVITYDDAIRVLVFVEAANRQRPAVSSYKGILEGVSEQLVVHVPTTPRQRPG
jgi:hypothetical protein